MVKSMTGFGRAEYSDEDRKITVEIKSVNHRFLDLSLRMPRSVSRFETDIRNILKRHMERGKVDVFIGYSSTGGSAATVRYDKNVAQQYADHLREMNRDLGLYEPLKPSVIAGFPDVFTIEEKTDAEDSELTFIADTVEQACLRFEESRKTEGENLSRDLLGKMDEIESCVSRLEELLPEVVRKYRENLQAKMEELLAAADIDENRIVQETAVYADHISVDEEMVRLHSHIQAVRDILQKDQSAGRKLDFIVQEMNREANTTLSKSDSLAVTEIGVDLKTCIEKVREQVQNIE